MHCYLDCDSGRKKGPVVRILVVDDFEPFRCWVSSFLCREVLWKIVAEASDGLDAIQKAEEFRPDLILLDIGLPKLSGIQAAQNILDSLPESKIIFVTQETSLEIVRETLRLGALGYVAKARAAAELTKAIEAALQGRRFISNGLARMHEEGVSFKRS